MRVALRVVIATDESIPTAELHALVEGAGLTIVGEAPAWDSVAELTTSRSADVVLVAGRPHLALGIATLAGVTPAIVIAPEGARPRDYAGSCAYALVMSTAPADLLAVASLLAHARAGELVRAKAEGAQLAEQLETRKLVERAKGVLMKRLNLSEEDAYRRLQKASQDENRKLRDIAESVLRAEKVFGLASLSERAQEPRRRVADEVSPIRHRV